MGSHLSVLLGPQDEVESLELFQCVNLRAVASAASLSSDVSPVLALLALGRLGCVLSYLADLC